MSYKSKTLWERLRWSATNSELYYVASVCGISVSDIPRNKLKTKKLLAERVYEHLKKEGKQL